MSEQRLTAVETKMTGIEKSFDRHTAAVEELARGVHAMAVKMEAIPDHEKRIRALEQQGFKLAGIGIAAGFVASHLSTITQAFGGG
jgi:DNA repair ATPase RecN